MVTELPCLFPSGSNYGVTFCSTLQILPYIFEVSQKRSKHVSLSNIHHSLSLPFGDATQQTEKIPCRGYLLFPLALFCSVLCPWTMPETLWLVTMKGRLLLTWKHPSVPYYRQDRKGRLCTVPKCPRDLSANTVISDSLCRSSFQRAQMGVFRHWPKGRSSGRHHTVVLNFSVANIHTCIHTYVPCFHQFLSSTLSHNADTVVICIHTGELHCTSTLDLSLTIWL